MSYRIGLVYRDDFDVHFFDYGEIHHGILLDAYEHHHNLTALFVHAMGKIICIQDQWEIEYCMDVLIQNVENNLHVNISKIAMILLVLKESWD